MIVLICTIFCVLMLIDESSLARTDNELYMICRVTESRQGAHAITKRFATWAAKLQQQAQDAGKTLLPELQVLKALQSKLQAHIAAHEDAMFIGYNLDGLDKRSFTDATLCCEVESPMDTCTNLDVYKCEVVSRL